MKNLLLLMLTLGFVGCASAPKLSLEEQSVKVVRGSYTLDGCVHKGVIREQVPLYFGADSYTKDHSGDAVRKAAYSMGANTAIMIKEASFEETAIAVAYFCK
jgi:hypothetical protein